MYRYSQQVLERKDFKIDNIFEFAIFIYVRNNRMVDIQMFCANSIANVLGFIVIHIPTNLYLFPLKYV